MRNFDASAVGTRSAIGDLRVGDMLPDLIRGPITRGTLALFAGASGDHVLLHIDSDYARAAGMDDVFAHGMLPMAYLGQLLTRHFGQSAVREWRVRFLAITPLYATVHCFAEIGELFEDAGERRARLRISARTADGLATLSGDAVVAIR